MPEGSDVAEAIRRAAELLSETSDTARLDAELLMANALGVDRSRMLLQSMSDPAPETFHVLVERRSRYEPVAHIVGHQEFYGLEFRVTPDVLIPRGDSETLVEAALELAGDEGRAIDLGTGSGALLLAFLANRAAWEGVGVDASERALAIAEKNAADLGLKARVRMLHRDWRNDGWSDDLGQFDLILCNPPYVEETAQLDPDVRDFEPHSALFAGAEGLDDYRALAPQLGKLLAPDGVALFEIGANQGETAAQIFRESGFSVDLRHDLADRPRVLSVS